MNESGNVVILLKYYGTSSKRRSFYDSSDKNDYLEYVSQGINQNKVIDYIDYSGDEEKSSGVFNQLGLLSKADKKKLREKLRNSNSCIWDMVISFKGEFGLNNLKDYQDALDLINKIYPKFIKDTGLEMDNITWYAGLHTNTKTRHIHLSFFENEPRTHDRLTKGVKYRYGKLPIDAINNFKMNIEKHYMSPITQVAQLRKQAIEEAKNFIMSKSTTGKEKLIRKQIKYLFDHIPVSSYKSYGREEMEPFRKIIDSISIYILEKSSVNSLYLNIKKEIKKRDEELVRGGGVSADKKICNFGYLNDINLCKKDDFTESLNYIHDTYVFDDKDKIKIDDIQNTLLTFKMLFQMVENLKERKDDFDNTKKEKKKESDMEM